MFPTFSFSFSFAISGLWGSIQLGVNQTIWHYQPFWLAENIHAIITYTPKDIVGLNISKKFTMLKIISKLFQFRQQCWIFAMWRPGSIYIYSHQTSFCNLQKNYLAFCVCVYKFANQFYSFQYFPSFTDFLFASCWKAII